jgi:hypothetical protein
MEGSPSRSSSTQTSAILHKLFNYEAKLALQLPIHLDFEYSQKEYGT